MQGDAASLHRLAVILLDNAIKYAGTGGAVTLTISVLIDRDCHQDGHIFKLSTPVAAQDRKSVV